jgi:uncharacterized protein (TIGR03435 family)
MEFTPDEVARRSTETTSPDPTGPSFLTALQEQLGLRLETTKGLVKFFVVDKVSKPSAN